MIGFFIKVILKNSISYDEEYSITPSETIYSKLTGASKPEEKAPRETHQLVAPTIVAETTSPITDIKKENNPIEPLKSSDEEDDWGDEPDVVDMLLAGGIAFQ